MEGKFSVSLELMIEKFKAKAKQAQDVSKNVANKIKENMSVKPTFDIDTTNVKLVESRMRELNQTVLESQEIIQYGIKYPAWYSWNTETIQKAEKDLKSANAEIEYINSSLSTMNTNLDKNSKSSIFFSNSFNKIQDGMNKSLKSAKRFTLSLFGIQSVYRMLSRASSSYLSQDQETSQKIQSAWIGLGSVFAPLLQTVANFTIKAVKYINVFIKALTGTDFLANAMAKSMNKANKSAGKLSKTLAGFDELTNLDDSAGGASVDTSWIDNFKSVELDESIVNWLQKIGEFLSPVVNGLKLLWEKTLPFRQQIGIGLKWFYDEVIVPMAKWASETVIPAVLDLISGSIEFLGTIIDIASPSLQWFWDTFLVPLGKFAWDILQKAVEGLTGAFKKLTDWAEGNETIVQLMANTMLGFFAGLIIYTVTKKLAVLLTALGTAFKVLAGGITLAGAASFIAYVGLALLVGGILLIAQNWDKMNDLEKVISVLGALAIAAAVAAVAVGALQSAWSLGIAAAAIIAGTVAITASVSSAQKRALKDTPKLAVGTPNVEKSGYAMIHEGEAVVPKKFNSDEYFGRLGGSNNAKVESLLEDLIDTLDRKDMNAYISESEVGTASVNYINNQNRIMGRGVI